jgi:hypothetical protein
LGILRAGIKDQIPMHRLMEIRYNSMASNPPSSPLTLRGKEGG